MDARTLEAEAVRNRRLVGRRAQHHRADVGERRSRRAQSARAIRRSCASASGLEDPAELWADLEALFEPGAESTTHAATGASFRSSRCSQPARRRRVETQKVRTRPARSPTCSQRGYVRVERIRTQWDSAPSTANGYWRGIDVDTCRAIAAAVFGDQGAGALRAAHRAAATYGACRPARSTSFRARLRGRSCATRTASTSPSRTSTTTPASWCARMPSVDRCEGSEGRVGLRSDRLDARGHVRGCVTQVSARHAAGDLRQRAGHTAGVLRRPVRCADHRCFGIGLRARHAGDDAWTTTSSSPRTMKSRRSRQPFGTAMTSGSTS